MDASLDPPLPIFLYPLSDKGRWCHDEGAMRIPVGFNVSMNRESLGWAMMLCIWLVTFDVPFLAATMSVKTVDYGVTLRSTGSNTALSDINGTLNQDALRIVSVSFSGSQNGDGYNELAFQLLDAAQKQAESVVPAKVIGKALMVPNPARQVDEPRLYYELSKNMDIEFRLYDMLARKVFSTTFPSGSDGGKEGANWRKLGLDTFDGLSLPAGVYIFLIMNGGKVLSKGKVAIIP